MELELYFRLKLEEPMSTNPNQFGGLDFTPLLDAVSKFTGVLGTVVTRLTTVAPAAGGTDPAASAAAQQEIQNIADQISTALTPLNAALNAANAAAGNPAPVAGTPVATTPVAPAPVDVARPPATATPAPADAGAPQTGTNVPGTGGTPTP